MPDPLIRPATGADLRTVMEIYNDQVRHGLSTFDTEPRDPDYFAPRLVSSNPGDVFLVAVRANTVVGFAYSGDFRPRPAYAGTRETSVYVADSARRQGVGVALYADLLGRLDAAGVHTQMAVIALPNDGSEALHRRFGFVHVGTLREVGRKFDRWVDTAWYQRIPPD